LYKPHTPPIKERLSIRLFGTTTFYTGLAIGIATTLILYLFFSYFREVMRLQLFYGDLLILTPKENLVYNLFFAAVAGAAGFSHTVWFWFHNPLAFCLSRRWVQSIRTTTLLWMLILLVVVMRMGTVAGLFMAQVVDFEDYFIYARDMGAVMVLLPLVVFFLIWMPIQAKYRAGRWVWISLLMYGTCTLILGVSSPVNHSRLNEAWHRHNAPYNAIVDAEIRRAHTQGISLPPEAIATLRLKYRNSVYELAQALKQAFKSPNSLSADSLVMELILVKRTTIHRHPSLDWDDPESLWPFALPGDVYHQLKLSRDSIKTAYLQELLHEYQVLFKAVDPWDTEDGGMGPEAFNRYIIQRRYKKIAAETTYYLDLLKTE
jgi:hypothetical protein